MADSRFGYGKLKNFLEPINSELLAILQAGTWSEWTKAWSSDPSFIMPQNILSNKRYRAGNVLACGYWMRRRGYERNIWATENQLRAEGFYVKEAAKVEKYRSFISLFSPNIREVENDEGEKEKKMFGIKSFTVINFNPDLIGEGAKAKMSVGEKITEWERANKIGVVNHNKPIDNAQQLTDKYLQHEKIMLVRGEPSYMPALDRIAMPELNDFTSSEAYYGTLLHECAHSTGHSSRIDRLESTSFGSPEYAYEELIAEMSAVYLSAALGIEYDLQHHASYLGSWLKGLQSDIGYFMKACTAAQKAMDYILTSAESVDTVGQADKELTDKELIAA